MKQLTQNLSNGKMDLLEVPFPALQPGQVLVRNHFSLISAGTEGKTVKDARLGLIAKARARKEEVKKVILTAKTIGIMNTYRLVKNRLDAPSSLGYSSSGEIIDVAENIQNLKVGDRVACAGASAVHAEVISVPVNLCSRVPENVSMEHAAFTTLGAIAMQGVRQSELKLGEHCVVIGLGLIGMLTMKILRASGIRCIGIDVQEDQVKMAIAAGEKYCFLRSDAQIESIVLHQTSGMGTDAVIITASTGSTDPVDLAGVLCRKKGKVVVVGAVPTGFQRKNYYQKELDLKMSSSYGPGRYDANYEEKGVDYPYAYVRWTENRNMAAFLDLLDNGSVNITSLVSHVFPVEKAKEAYEIILNKSQPFTGILFRYDQGKEISNKIILRDSAVPVSNVSIGMIGAGSFGQNFLLPALKGKAEMYVIATARPNNARNIADKYGFAMCSGDSKDVIENNSVNTVIIATRHNSHAEYVLRSLRAKKNVYTEKPLCLNRNELNEIAAEYQNAKVQLMVGFNRRFSPMVQELKQSLRSEIPTAIHYRINAGIVPNDHWIHDPGIGGGRIIGEVCHFIDLCAFLVNSPVISVTATALQNNSHNNDTACINLQFANGSIASISYFSNGNKEVSKERIEVYNGGLIGIIDDFSSLSISDGSKTKKKSKSQNKGYSEEITAFIGALKDGGQSAIPFDSIYNTTLATLMVAESISEGGKNMPVKAYGE